MKLAMLSFSHNLNHFGILVLNQYLRSKGHEVDLYFVFDPQDKGSRTTEYRAFSLEKKRKLREALETYDFIGCSFMSPLFTRAADLTKFLKSTDLRARIIWGGTGPILSKEMMISHTDILCIGEGEGCLSEFLASPDRTDVAGLYFNCGGKIIKNDRISCIENLDILPSRLFSPGNEYIMKGDNIALLNMERYHQEMSTTYWAFTSRGCPYSCSYCSNPKIYGPQSRKVRKRSIGHVLEELRFIKKEFPFITNIRFSDDNFLTVRSKEELSYFADGYKKEINLMFDITGITPHTPELKEKLEILFSAGLYTLRMGIQSGCEKTLKLYNRYINPQETLNATKIIDSFRRRMDYHPTYDVIYPQILEHSEEDFVQTNRLLAKIKKPFHLNLYNLTLYPGTALFDYCGGDLFDLDIPAYRKKYYIIENKYFYKVYFVNAAYPLGFFFAKIMQKQRYKNIFIKVIINILFNLIPATRFMGKAALFSRKKIRNLFNAKNKTRARRLLYIMNSSSKFLATRGWEYARERSLGEYFDFVVSIHLPTEEDNFIQLGDNHIIVEIGTRRFNFIRPKTLKKLVYSFWVFLRSWNLALQYKTNVVRAGDPYFIGFLSWIIARLNKNYYCIALRTPYDLRYKLEGPTIMFPEIFGSRRLAKVIERFTLGKADLVMARSQNLVNYAVSNGADNRKIRLDRFGVHTELFLRPAQKDLKNELSLKDKKIVLHVGRLNRENYVYDILEVARRICLKFPDIVFVLVGEGSERKNLEQLTGQAGLADRVLFRGTQPYDLIPDYRRVADVNLALMAGNSLVEAALSGKPVIAYDVDWHRELIIHEKTGILLAENDLGGLETNILRLINDPLFGQRLAEMAKVTAINLYSYEKSLMSRRGFYDELFNTRKR